MGLARPIWKEEEIRREMQRKLRRAMADRPPLKRRERAEVRIVRRNRGGIETEQEEDEDEGRNWGNL